MNRQVTDALVEAVDENSGVVQFSIFDTPALSDTAIVTVRQYKQVLDYLNLDTSDNRFYDNGLKTRIKNIYSKVILYKDILNYYIKYSNNLKNPELFSDDWCFLVAILLVEKNMYQRKHAVSPLHRIAEFVNAYLYAQALASLPEFEFLDGSDNHTSFAKRDYNNTPDFRYKDIYTASAKKNTISHIAKILLSLLLKSY